ncbi:hypothetical protein AB3662_04940 [Sorangium cellulosum]|uniref:hypothetical protein n=1 Tax=Sorangium cellulosum TaxID=56 RepID=UPI003D9A4DBA
MEQCYNGPEDTADVGSCRSGLRTCNGDGSAWGACNNEKLPDQESCAFDEDENCDGFDCTLWAQSFGKEAVAHSVATDKEGSIIAAGRFFESIQFGAEPLASAGEADAFVAAFDRSGNHLWSHTFGDAAAQEATSVSVDASGNVIVTGVSSGTINFGGPDVGPGVFVAKFSNSGKHAWSRSFPANPINERKFDGFVRTVRPKVKSTPHGDVIIAGTFRGNIEIDDTTLVSTPANTLDMYLAKLDGSTGFTSAERGGWVRQLGSSEDDALIDVAVDRGENVILTGEHRATITFGDLPQLDGPGMFLVKLDRDGTPAWSHSFANGHPSALDVDTLGNISTTGNYGESIEFGDNWTLASQEGHTAFFVAQFDTSGDHRWSRDFEGTGHNAIGGISADSSNDLVLIGEFAEELRVDNEILEHHELPSPWVLKLDASGNTLWAKSYGAHGISFGIAVETDPSNEIVVTGSFSSGIDFETGTLEAEADALFLAKLGI